MAIKDTSVLSLLGAIVFSGVLGMAGKDMYVAMSEKAQAQHDAVESLRDWKRQYQALLPVEQRWNTTLSPFSEFRDLYQLHIKLNEGDVGIDADKLIASKIERFVDGNSDLGAQRVCMGFQGGLFNISAKSYVELNKKVTAFIKRPDIEFGNFTFQTSDAQHKASVTIDPVCLILRDGLKEGEK